MRSLATSIGSRMSTSVRSRVLWSGLALFVLAAVLLGVATVVYAMPGDQDARSADVVFVIGPPTNDRVELAESLVEAGVADAVMVSIRLPEAAAPADTGWPKPSVPSWAALGSWSEDRAAAACADGAICLQPEPFTTQGEAQALAAAMDENGWDTAIVVTMTPHVARTRLIFSRCIEDGVQVIGVDDGLDFGGWVYQFAYQTGGFVKAAVTPEC